MKIKQSEKHDLRELDSSLYTSPEVDIFEIEVEKGFAGSGKTEAFGSDPGYW